jgi:hypothetical protein
MQRLQLKHRGKLLRAAHLLRDHIRGDFGRQREGKSHKGGIVTSVAPVSMSRARNKINKNREIKRANPSKSGSLEQDRHLD